ncbi:MAG: pyridoxal-phosphate dependent enzyme [Spirochaetaceae bacterium]|nr:MAG: pyridoxal-phosphate dependent enzyme [Spirochaetaceae bacterium]
MPGQSSARFVCAASGATYPLTDRRWRCDSGGLLDLEFEPAFPRELIVARPPGMWRYREAIPVFDDDAIVSFGEGFTPMVPVRFGERTVLIKQEQLFPSASYKDRGASVLISHAREIGVSRVVEDSSGNAGTAVAAYCARAGIDCEIFVPADTSSGKLAQIRSYGATLNLVPGSREDTAAAVLAAADADYYASHSYNPFFFHGTKTFAFEVWEQLGWTAPDAVVLPAGNGTLLLGVAIGFAELRRAGLIAKQPTLFGVQAQNCAPLAAAFRAGDTEPSAVATTPTIAEGIAIAAPVRGAQIIAAVRESGGRIVTVSEAEIKTAHREMSRQGFCIEPTSAATIAAIDQIAASLPADATIVSLFSGHGLKAPEKLPV